MSIEGIDKPTKTSGGTASILPNERAKATFDVNYLKNFLQGGEEILKEREIYKILFKEPLFDFTYDVHDNRDDAMRKSVARTVRAKEILKKNPDLLSTHMGPHMGEGGPGFPVGAVSQSGSSSIGNHYAIFVGAILARASPEQRAKWFKKAIELQILGAYAQTELGHGSNVRALETTATYDSTTEEFVINSPTLTSLKWWPGCFGLVATHSVVYARLILNGKDYGIHEFMVQLRDENHKPMPGIEVGDIGPKMGYNLVDSGYCRFDNVRIPRDHMLMGESHVTKEGKYERHSKVKIAGGGSEKLKYIVMIQTRVSLIVGAANALSKACTIAIRYSAVRKQGFKNTRENSLQSGENAVLDYQVQQYRLFKALSMAYAFYFVAKISIQSLLNFRNSLNKGDGSDLAELHATAAGLKAFCTNYTGDMIEECRRCCGGHGSTLNSGIAKLVVDYNSISPIAEGDKVVLVLQTARYLVRAVQAVANGKETSGQAQYLSLKPALPNFNNLRDLNQLLHAFLWRARNSVFIAASIFDKRLKSGEAFDIAWNNCAVVLHKATEDHCFYVILLNFINGINAIKDNNVQRVLERLATHFALVQIREHGMDWTPHLSLAQVQSLDVEICTLLSEIRPDAVSLVDAFGFSDHTLQSTLGRYDGNVYEALYDYAKKNPLNKEEYVHKLWEESLKGVLDLDYLKKSKQLQRVREIDAKL